MAEQFAACIPETKISPAECQGYLMRHRDDPHAALSNAEAWATEVITVKEKGKNVADFDNEIKRGGALFAGRGTRLPPNGMNGTNVTVSARPHRLDPLAPASRARLRADARAMMAQGTASYAPANGNAEDYDSGIEGVMDDVMDDVTHIVSSRYTNGNGVEELGPYDEEGSADGA